MTSNLSSTSHSDKDDRAVYQLVFGEEFGAYVYERVQDGLGDLPTYINSFVVREMWSRPGLDLKTKFLVAVGMFLVMQREEVKFFVVGALVQGATKQEIEEVLMLLAAEAGFPAAFHASAWIKQAYEDYEKFAKK